uniref:protein-serine/threonine phosphatase n=1 Tax=Rhizophora mucronata TaxID=61149 RepID=A0A2P2MVQ5_RHIMU
MYRAVAEPFRVGNLVSENSTLDARFDIARLKLMADTVGLLSDPVTTISTVGDVNCICGDLDNEVSNMASDVEDNKGRAPLLDVVSENKTHCVVSDEFISRESEEDDSLSLEGDQALDSLSVASETSSLCREDLLSITATSEQGSLSALDVEKSICNIDISAKATDLGESIVETKVIGDPFSMAVSLKEEIGDQSDPKPSSVVLQLAVEKGVSRTFTRSAFEVDYVPLWGFASLCGRRPEMEDAVATIPYFMKVPVEMLVDDHVLDGISKCLTHQTAHFFGVYDGHGGSQVAKYCQDHIHSVLAAEIDTVKNGLVNRRIKFSCQEQWRKAFTDCFLEVDAVIGGKGNAEPIAPETVGSTAVVAIICSSHIIVANCGDSRAVLCRGKEPVALSRDHKVRAVWLSCSLGKR